MAIVMVLIGHCSRTAPAAFFPGRFGIMISNGSLGVLVFFCISGFLITRLLLNEEDKYGQISLKKFYLRRAFRILPAFIFFISFVVVLKACGLIDISVANIVSALFFVSNYSPANRNWILAHTWTLSVEEQFYLIWPAILVFCNRRRAMWIGIVLIAIEPPLRVIHYLVFPDLRGQISIMLHTRIDALMFGCVAAIAGGQPWFERLYFGLCKWQMHWILPLFVFSIAPFIPGGGMYVLPVGYTLDALASTLLMVWLIRNPASWCGKIFNLKFIAWIGVLSYSLYLWQQPFFSKDSLGWPTRFGYNIACVFGCAIASYYLVEQPFLRLRNRFVR